MMTEYERGYLDGVAAASDKIASFFHAQKDKDAQIASQMHAAHAMMHGVMLKVLAPLQDEVRHQRPPETAP